LVSVPTNLEISLTLMERDYQDISSQSQLLEIKEPSLISPLLLKESENITDAQLYKELSWKMAVEVEPLHLTSRESSSFMSKCLQEVSMVEESLSSVCPYSKDLDGISQTTTMLNLTSTVKVKDAVSSLEHAAAAALSLMSSAQAAAVDVPLLVEEVVNALVTPLWMDANSTNLMKIMIVKTPMVRITQDSPLYKFSEEDQAADASLVTLTQDLHLTALQLSASSTLAVELEPSLKLTFKLEAIR